MTEALTVELPVGQLGMLRQLAASRGVTPAELVAKWVPQHLGTPCPDCLHLRDVSREASYTPDGLKWHSAFQENVLLMRCMNEHCRMFGVLVVIDPATLMPRIVSGAPDAAS